MERQMHDRLKYLAVSERDEEWGIVVTTVGYQFIPPKSNYPLSKHPDQYCFKPQRATLRMSIPLGILMLCKLNPVGVYKNLSAPSPVIETF